MTVAQLREYTTQRWLHTSRGCAVWLGELHLNKAVKLKPTLNPQDGRSRRLVLTSPSPGRVGTMLRGCVRMPLPAAPPPSCLCDLGGPLPSPSPRVPCVHPLCKPVAAAPGTAQPWQRWCHVNITTTRLRALGFVDDPPVGSGDPHRCSRRRWTTNHKTDLEPRHVPGRVVSPHLHLIV